MPSPSKSAPQTKGPQKLQPTTGSLITRVLHSTVEVEMHSTQNQSPMEGASNGFSDDSCRSGIPLVNE
jgi:hypothetical protein